MESELLPRSDELRRSARPDQTLTGRALYCLFYEPSFLTRTSFERAIGLLGGEAYHTEDASQFYPVRTPDHIDNIISILASLHVDLVVLRNSDAGIVDSAAKVDALPIVNGGVWTTIQRRPWRIYGPSVESSVAWTGSPWLCRSSRTSKCQRPIEGAACSTTSR